MPIFWKQSKGVRVSEDVVVVDVGKGGIPYFW